MSDFISVWRLKEQELICIWKNTHALSLELILKQLGLLMTQNYRHEH